MDAGFRRLGQARGHGRPNAAVDDRSAEKLEASFAIGPGLNAPRWV